MSFSVLVIPCWRALCGCGSHFLEQSYWTQCFMEPQLMLCVEFQGLYINKCRYPQDNVPAFMENPETFFMAKLGTTSSPRGDSNGPMDPLELVEAPQLYSFPKKRNQTSHHFSEPTLFRSSIRFLYQLTGNGEIERSN